MAHTRRADRSGSRRAATAGLMGITEDLAAGSTSIVARMVVSSPPMEMHTGNRLH